MSREGRSDPGPKRQESNETASQNTAVSFVFSLCDEGRCWCMWKQRKLSLRRKHRLRQPSTFSFDGSIAKLGAQLSGASCCTFRAACVLVVMRSASRMRVVLRGVLSTARGAQQSLMYTYTRRDFTCKRVL